MKNAELKQLDALTSSIGEICEIGKPKKEFEYKSKKVLADLKKSRAELMQEAFVEAFEPNKD